MGTPSVPLAAEADQFAPTASRSDVLDARQTEFFQSPRSNNGGNVPRSLRARFLYTIVGAGMSGNDQARDVPCGRVQVMADTAGLFRGAMVFGTGQLFKNAWAHFGVQRLHHRDQLAHRTPQISPPPFPRFNVIEGCNEVRKPSSEQVAHEAQLRRFDTRERSDTELLDRPTRL